MKKIPDFACPDTERYIRQGFFEAIYCSGKSTKQIIAIMKEMLKGKATVMATRATPSIYRAVKKEIKPAEYYPQAHIIAVKKKLDFQRCSIKPSDTRTICIVTAGTTDISVAEECAVTCELLGSKVYRIYDVGVAGVHRLFKHKDKLQKSSCVVVCAGMDGVLPSVVGGLVGSVVIGVPTSVGYGANFKGISALLTMLNSCAANVCVVSIDDGFGAGVVAHLINRG